MKNLFLLSAVFLLTGCAMGINHNVVTFDDKPYLVENKTYEFLRLIQWSTPSTITPLKKPIEFQNTTRSTGTVPSVASEQLKAVIEKCRLKDGLSSRNVNYRRLYKCVVEELAELE